MFGKILKKTLNVLNPLYKAKILGKIGIKCLKAFIDKKFRDKVVPVEGSVVYSDLYIGAEHSGIYIGDNEITNIVVDGLTDSSVEKSSPEEFTDKSFLHKNIYVSCDSKGAVGNKDVCSGAINHLGERSFYGLVFKNCHEFSVKCVSYSKKSYTLKNIFKLSDLDETWESSIKSLKKKSKEKLGATKWKLWDWQNEIEQEEEPDLNEIENFWKNLVLNEENIKVLRDELSSCNEYINEISDENIPKETINLLTTFRGCLETVDKKYREVESFIKIVGCEYSYNEFLNMGEDFSTLVNEMKNNKEIKEIIRKLGREYISEEKKQRPKVIKRSNNEVLGVHKSNDLMRILPSELTNIESEELEYLFYSKFFENGLLTYEIISKGYEYNSNNIEEFFEKNNKNKGPVIACLDTSGSMYGMPILKAKALLLSISKILEKENRSLYIIIFGDTEQIKELNISEKQESNKILPFLNSGFGGGTDFETPIKKGVEIIRGCKDYSNADILMITDGLCTLSEDFIKVLKQNKKSMDFNLYTVICTGDKVEDKYSDEIINV